MRKLLLSIILIISIIVPVSAEGAREDGTLRIGISKLLSHPALDAIERGISDYLEDEGIDADIEVQNANGEISTAASIAQLFRTEGKDIVIGIATPTAQALANVFDDIPVIYSSVTDVKAAGLDGLPNVCGVSDQVPAAEHYRLIEEITEAERIGMVYTSGEANGISAMEQMAEICRENGTELVTASVSNSAEVRMAALSIIDRVDAMYVAIDNTVVSAIASLSDVCSDASVPLFSADVTSAEGTEVLLAGGFDYYASGRLTGEIVKRIINGESCENIGTEYLTDLELYVNLATAGKLGLDIPEGILGRAKYIIE